MAFLAFAIQSVFNRLIFHLLQDWLENVARDDWHQLVGDLVHLVGHQDKDEGGQDQVQDWVSLG